MTQLMLSLLLKGGMQIVPQESATLPGYPLIGIHNDHMSMCKFSETDDPGFVAMSGELRRMAKRITQVPRIMTIPIRPARESSPHAQNPNKSTNSKSKSHCMWRKIRCDT